MHRFLDKQAIQKIRNQECFSACDIDGAWKISIKDYVPLVCLALHDGSLFPSALEEACLLKPSERVYEEDPHLGKMLDTLPIVISGLESRYFYDLNRAPEGCAQNFAFEREVWRQGDHPMPHLAKQRHQRFYDLLDGLLQQLVAMYGSCLVMDVHSYNYTRISGEAPMFNLGTKTVDQMNYRSVIDYLVNELNDIQITGEMTRVAENEVFHGAGYLVRWMNERYPKCLALPLEIKKVYCNEFTGELRHLAMGQLSTQLQSVIGRTAHYYFDKYNFDSTTLKAEKIA